MTMEPASSKPVPLPALFWPLTEMKELAENAPEIAPVAPTLKLRAAKPSPLAPGVMDSVTSWALLIATAPSRVPVLALFVPTRCAKVTSPPVPAKIARPWVRLFSASSVPLNDTLAPLVAPPAVVLTLRV